MGRYEAAIRGATAAAGAAFATIDAPTRLSRIREIGFSSTTAVSAMVGLGRPANTPVPTGTIAGLPANPGGPAGTTRVAATWSTPPTAPAFFYRRLVLPSTIGAGVIWTFPPDEPLIIEPVATRQFLVLWNFNSAAGPVNDLYVVWDE